MKLLYVPSRWIASIALVLLVSLLGRIVLLAAGVLNVNVAFLVGAQVAIGVVLFLSTIYVLLLFARSVWDSSSTIDLGTLEQPVASTQRDARGSGVLLGAPSVQGQVRTGSSSDPKSQADQVTARLELLAKLRASGDITAEEEAHARENTLRNA